MERPFEGAFLFEQMVPSQLSFRSGQQKSPFYVTYFHCLWRKKCWPKEKTFAFPRCSKVRSGKEGRKAAQILEKVVKIPKPFYGRKLGMRDKFGNKRMIYGYARFSELAGRDMWPNFKRKKRLEKKVNNMKATFVAPPRKLSSRDFFPLEKQQLFIPLLTNFVKHESFWIRN